MSGRAWISFAAVSTLWGMPYLLIALAVLGAAFGYAVGPMVFKRHLRDLDPRASMARRWS